MIKVLEFSSERDYVHNDDVLAPSKDYELHNGILYYKPPTRSNLRKLAVPKTMQLDLEQEFHDGLFSAHLSAPKVQYKLM